MGDLDKARRLFTDAGLGFPKIPEALAGALVEREDWVFSTRPLDESPYALEHHLAEDAGEDFAVLAHTGQGTNAWAVQYYLGYRGLRLFLHLGWGGAYMDGEAATAQVRQCLATADRIVTAATGRGRPGDAPTTIVVAGLGQSRWAMSQGPDASPSLADDPRPPAEVLAELLARLEPRPAQPARR